VLHRLAGAEVGVGLVVDVEEEVRAVHAVLRGVEHDAVLAHVAPLALAARRDAAAGHLVGVTDGGGRTEAALLRIVGLEQDDATDRGVRIERGLFEVADVLVLQRVVARVLRGRRIAAAAAAPTAGRGDERDAGERGERGERGRCEDHTASTETASNLEGQGRALIADATYL
jgi:hypothetical protein